MALTPYQTAQKDWASRASQFRNANIPDAAWQQLYYRDMQGVFSGSQPMSNSEIYAGVSAAMGGTRLNDPLRPTGGGGSFLSHIGDIIKNVPSDVSSIITGLEGIPHLIAHFPQEVDQTGKLLYNISTTNNAWLQKNGYLPAGENLHNSWGDFGKILQAMNENGSKQLLPFLPFLSDIANMTSGQGRNYLQQHPVTAFLDVLPGIVKVGHLATDSLDLEANAATRASYVKRLVNTGIDSAQAERMVNQAIPKDYNYAKPQLAGAKVPRFYAAGRALQTGNPVKALVSATGDLIPAGKDQFGARVTLRQWANVKASAAGIDRFTREGLNRPIHDASDELTARAKSLVQKYFGDTPFLNGSPERNYYMYLGMHGINPDTGVIFESVQEYDNWFNNSLDPHEKAAVDTARAIVADQEAHDNQIGARASVPNPETRSEDIFATSSPVYKAWQKVLDAEAHYQEIKDEQLSYARPAGMPARFAKRGGDAAAELKALKSYEEAVAAFNKLRHDTIPDAWQPAITQTIRSKMEAGVKHLQASKMMDDQEAADAMAKIKSSIWDDDMRRVFGDEMYNAYLTDAMDMWRRMASQGFRPLYMIHIDPSDLEGILNPSIGRLDKPLTPTAFKPETEHLFFGPTVHNIAMAVTARDIEFIRQQMVTRLIQETIIPQFTVSRQAKRIEYMQALGDAANARKVRLPGGVELAAQAQRLLDEDFDHFDPANYGIRADTLSLPTNDLLITKEASNVLRDEMSPTMWMPRSPLGRAFKGGTSIYKFSVLTGPRHLAHVALGGMAFMLGRQPLAAAQLFKSAHLIRALRTAPDDPATLAQLKAVGLEGKMLSGLRGKVYDTRTLHKQWYGQVGVRLGEDLTMDWIHQAAQKGEKVATYLPNKLAQFEELIMDMYRISAFLDAKRSGLDRTAALEQAHKTFVDINGMSHLERTVVKQIFPFYAFTRHLFRYLMTYPVDYPLRAAILTNIAQGYQQDWTSGLPRSYMSLFNIGTPDKNGNILTFDLKNLNPFRSFANDWSMAGFTSSLTPFMSGALAAVGLDTLSGTTQLYPGTIYNPQTGALQSTPPPGGMISVAEAFVPQLGLLDHFLKISNSTKMLARFSPLSYNKQLWNMLNVPFVPEVINVPYEKEITEVRRFRQAQKDVTALEDDPSAKNVSKVMEWNLVPWNNELIPPASLAAYYKRAERAFAGSQFVGVAPKAMMIAPPKRVATLQSF